MNERFRRAYVRLYRDFAIDRYRYYDRLPYPLDVQIERLRLMLRQLGFMRPTVPSQPSEPPFRYSAHQLKFGRGLGYGSNGYSSLGQCGTIPPLWKGP